MTAKEEMRRHFLKRAAELARFAVDNGLGGPFGAVVVKDNTIIGEGYNQVTSGNDPTAHAEIVAIRDACAKLGSFQLTGCEIYSSCEPCPMCMGAIYWARPAGLFFGATRHDAARAGFDDAFIYHELALPAEKRKIPVIYLPDEASANAFDRWKGRENKTNY